MTPEPGLPQESPAVIDRRYRKFCPESFRGSYNDKSYSGGRKYCRE